MCCKLLNSSYILIFSFHTLDVFSCLPFWNSVHSLSADVGVSALVWHQFLNQRYLLHLNTLGNTQNIYKNLITLLSRNTETLTEIKATFVIQAQHSLSCIWVSSPLQIDFSNGYFNMPSFLHLWRWLVHIVYTALLEKVVRHFCALIKQLRPSVRVKTSRFPLYNSKNMTSSLQNRQFRISGFISFTLHRSSGLALRSVKSCVCFCN